MRAVSRPAGKDALQPAPVSDTRVAIPLLAIPAAVPLVIAPGLFFSFDVTPKVVILLIGAGAALALWRGPLIAANGPARRLQLVLAAGTVSLLLSLSVSSDPALSFAGANWRRFGVLTQIALLAYTWLLSLYLAGSSDGRRLRFLLRAIVAGGLPAALYGIAQYFGRDPFLPAPAYHVGEGVWQIVRPPGPLGHADYFGVYLLAVTFAAGELAARESRQWWRAAAFLTGLLAPAAIMLSGTRAAILGLAAGAATFLFLRRPRLSRRRVFSASILLAASAAFYFSPAGLALRSRTRWFKEDPYGGGRLRLWSDTLAMSGHRLIAGFGPETFSFEFPRYESEALARQFPDQYYESPHNILLDGLASQGGLGMILPLTLVGLALWSGRGRDSSAVALPAGLVALFAGNQFLSFTVPTALVFDLFAAALCTLPVGAFSRANPSIADRPPKAFAASRARKHAVWQRPVFCAASALFLLAAFSLTWTDFFLARTGRALASGQSALAAARYQQAQRFRLPGVDTDFWYSRALLAAAGRENSELQKRLMFEQALQAAVRAASSSEQRFNAWYSLASFYGLQNDLPGAERSLRQAIFWAPQWFKPHWILAQVLQQAGRGDEAMAEAAVAAQLDAGKDSQVSRTLAAIAAERSVREPSQHP